jgi:catechol 2,3-dioxygenase-like lactoylglutathione lyase family enzyme
MICREAERLTDFYERAFGFVRTNQPSKADPALAKLIGLANGKVRIESLRLGNQKIALAQVYPLGRDYPSDIAGSNTLFQHFAIVVSNMTAAYARLQALRGWTTISTDGPQTLPPSSGAVTAYKFRDPEGHPLELLAYPSGAVPARWAIRSTNPCLGIDHSAISVTHTERSVLFYRRLGLDCIGTSLNHGPEQEKLDDIAAAIVEVTAVAPPTHSTPHVELLCYRGNFDRRMPLADPNDLAATQLVFEMGGRNALDVLMAGNREATVSGPIESRYGLECALLRDPDGHLLRLEAPPDKGLRSHRLDV